MAFPAHRMQRIGQKSVFFLRVRSFAAFQNVEALIRHILTTQQLQLTPSSETNDGTQQEYVYHRCLCYFSL